MAERKINLTRQFAILFISITATACAVNPVTGQRELSLVSESQEIAIGQQQYLPSRQMQGGDYRVDPNVSRYVQAVGQKLARVSDRPDLPYEFTVLNNPVPNAWALPGGKIAINTGLLVELKSEAELAAVMGHEIVHAAARHGASQMSRGVALQGAMTAIGIGAQGSDNAQMIVGGAMLAAKLVSTKYGRDDERESDRYGMIYMKRAGYDPTEAVTLQETFVRLSAGRQSDWLSGLFASHPPSQERVDNNRMMVAELGGGGMVGREPYAQAMARIVKTREAYTALAQGEQALAKGDTATALKMAERALAIEPREGKAHALRGAVRYQQKRYNDALTNFDRALNLNPAYFEFYLGSGLTRKALGDVTRAKTDLEQANRLLPTAPAHLALGQISKSQGQTAEAAEHFKVAAQSKSSVGETAAAELARMEIGSNPQQFVQLGARLNERGYVVLQVKNAAPIAVKDVMLRVTWIDAKGSLKRDLKGTIEQQIPAGQTIELPVDIGPLSSTAELQQIGAQVLSAATVD